MSEIYSVLPARPSIEKRRLEAVRRTLTVDRVVSLTPKMLRVTLTGDDLEGFVSPSPDDHIKVFFPLPGGDVAARDYTPRRYDASARTIAIDFFLHEGGAGSSWAQQAVPGDALQIGGPRGSTVITAPGAWWLLIGDESALPSIGRRLEEASAGVRVITLVSVTGLEEEQRLKTSADHLELWAHRPATQGNDPGPILNALRNLTLPAGDGFIWIGAEEEVARAIRDYMVGVVGHAPDWIKASSYWSHKGQ